MAYDKKWFVKKSKSIYGTSVDYSKVVYKNTKTKVILRCLIHNIEFDQSPKCHFQYFGCRKCSSESKAKTTEQFVKESQVIHGDSHYDYSNVVYKANNIDVDIFCNTHEEIFKQTPQHHLRGSGCPKCSREQSRKTTEVFVAESIEVHDKFNTRYDYSKTIYEKVIITCKLHGDFDQRPMDHINGQGCPDCGKEKILEKNAERALTTEEFIRRSKDIHKGLGYLNTVYVNFFVKVIVTCNKHGDFKTIPSNHLNKNKPSGCPKCGKESMSDKLRLTKEQFVERSEKSHDEVFDYSKSIYKDNVTSVIIICGKKHEFKQAPRDHMRGHGCPICARKSYSKKAIMWLDCISRENKITIQHAENGGEHKIDGTRYRVDGYCEETNTAYEFNGTLWHGHPDFYDSEDTNPFSGKTYGELYEKTLKKEEMIRELGYNLVVIWEHDFDENYEIY